MTNITDELVLNAIGTHSDTGEKLDSDVHFQWCLQVVDILTPVAAWHGMRKLKTIVCAGRLDDAALLRCGWLREYFQRANVPIHPNLERKYRMLTPRLKVSYGFFERE